MNTTEDYERALKEAIGHHKCEVIDIYAVPDYTKIFQDQKCYDSKFGGYAKTDKTQHQFTFEAVNRSDKYRFGCKVTYRAYASDNVIEIVEGINETLPGLRIFPRQCFVHTYPEEEDGTPSGILIQIVDYLSSN